MSSLGKKRTHINKETETYILTASRRRCCLCYFLDDRKTSQKGQIAHINRDRSDSNAENLVYLCLNHHDDYDSKPSQSKAYTQEEIRTYRDKLYKYLETTDIQAPNAHSDIHEFDPDFDIEEELNLVKRSKPHLKFLDKPWKLSLPVEGGEELFAFKSHNHFDGICSIERISLPDDRIVIICEEVNGNPGISVTNAVEDIAFQVCQQFQIDPQNLVWIEHYNVYFIDEPEWNLVKFNKIPPDDYFEGPSWKPMTPKDWQQLGFRPKVSKSKHKKEPTSRIQWYKR